MACQNVCKQGRDDVRVKVNLQSLIPASFYTSLHDVPRSSVYCRKVPLAALENEKNLITVNSNIQTGS